MKTVYALVCLDWNGHEVYSSFFNDKSEAIKQAEVSLGVIRVEEAHSKKEPIWIRNELT